MRWTDKGSSQFVPLDIQLALCRESARQYPNDVEKQARLGDALFNLEKYEEAAEAFARASSAHEHQALALAQCYLNLNRADDALQVCEQNETILPKAAMGRFHYLRGLALKQLSRWTDAQDAFIAAMRASPFAYSAAASILTRLAKDPDDGRLLEFCGDLSSDYSNCTVVRGYRAMGLSCAGRVDDARKLVDLDRHIWQVPFEPQPQFGGIEKFNTLLAKEILENPGLVRARSYNFLRTRHMGLASEHAFAAITLFMRDTIEKYLESFPLRGLDGIMPPAPREGSLFTAANVVLAGEKHSAHLHKFAYVSGVYHVSIPENDDNQAGALLVGPWNTSLNPRTPCWGSRHVKPVAGTATIFPSHFFHSVVETGKAEPRIAIAFDLCPPGQSRSEPEQ